MKQEFLYWKITEFARRSPQKAAIISEEQRISYLDLEKKSNRIANFMQEKIGEIPHVVILLDRSPGLIEAIIGLLKAGLVFVPLNPSFPASRVKQMIEEIKAEWIITDTKGYETFKDMINEKGNGKGTIKTLLMDETDDNPALKDNMFYLDPNIESDKLVFERKFNKNCYIYFTSGSTGIPKGVLGGRGVCLILSNGKLMNLGSMNISMSAN